MPVDTELYIAFVVAASALVLMPGPIVTLVIANSLKHGMRTGVLTSVGANTGTSILITAGGFGLTGMMAAAGDLFEWVRWAGVVYLIYLGVREWRTALKRTIEADGFLPADKKPNGVFWHGFVVALTNPKTIFFFVAFFPQFIDPSKPAGPQVALLSATFVVIALLLDGGYALLAGRLRGFLVGAKRVRIRHGITGTLLICTGIGMMFARRGS